jgi:ATP-dependent protease ClpP protease subunit
MAASAPVEGTRSDSALASGKLPPRRAIDIAIQAEQFTRMRELMAELTAQHTGQPFARVLEDGERDRWFTPEEALEYGLIDFIHPATKRG